MITPRRRIFTLLMALTLLLLASSGGRAAPRTREGHAAVVVRFSDGYTVVRVMPLAVATVTGLALLQASGLGVILEGGAEGAAVCQIGPQGCAYPAQPCFCACPGGPNCAYWNYRHWRDGAWAIAPEGALRHVVTAGGVDGWAWGGINVNPPPVAPEALFDTQRLAPGVPVISGTAQTLALSVDFQGDENDNATVAASYQLLSALSASLPLTLTRQGRLYTAAVEGLSAGRYEIEVRFDDPDGVNGSVSRWLTVTVAAEPRLLLPLLVNGASPP